MERMNKMDISVIDATKVTKENGLIIGSDSAPVKIVEFMNVRCPYCKKWFEESKEVLNQAVAAGKVQRIIKLLDKEKESLQRGNVMHHHINYDHPEKALAAIEEMYKTQNLWGDLTLEEVATFAETKLSLVEDMRENIVASIIDEANQANIKFVPTVVIDDHIFDESISKEELINYLNGN